MKALLEKLCWKFKIGWELVGGHWPGTFDGPYRFVWMHRRTHEIRTEDRKVRSPYY